MKKSRFAGALALALAAGFAPVASNAQVVVTDPLGQVQWVQSAITLTNQLTTLKSQLQTQINQYTAITGNLGNFGSFLNTDVSQIKNQLPSNWTTVYNDALNSGSSGYNARSTQILSTVMSKIDGMGRGDALTYANGQIQQKGATDRAMGEQAYNNEMAELTNIQSLTNQINSATSAKEIADLQARIATARGAIQAEQTKLTLMGQLASAQDKILQQQQAEATLRHAVGTASDDNTAPTITP